MNIPNKILSNGYFLPMMGLGVFKITEKEKMEASVTAALDAGYRLFDTAQMYGNEALLGNALRNTGIPRSEYFLTTKLEPSNSANPEASVVKSLEDLKSDYLDLFMIHWPGQRKERLIRIWNQLEDMQKQGLIRSLGVCNCTKNHLQWILEDCEISPVVHQVEHHPLLNEAELYAFCREKGIQLQAWAPLMRGNLEHPVFVDMARRYQKSVAQMILRWNLQHGFSVIPKSVQRDRIFENADIFDFSLSSEDLLILDSMHTGQRSGKDPFTYDYDFDR